VSLAEAKAQLRIAPDDLSADDQLLGYIEAVTESLEDYKHLKIPARVVTDEMCLPRRSRRFRVWSAPLLTLTSVTAWDGSQSWDVTQMRGSESGLVRVITGPLPGGEIVVTYTAGMQPVPWRYKQGALVMLAHCWETQRGQGTVGSGVIGPEEHYRQPGEFFTVPNKVKEWLGPPRPVVA
jgi:Phage gp6-like head-tail connector protein